MAKDQEVSFEPPEDQRNFIVRHWKAIVGVIAIVLLAVVLVRYLQRQQPAANPRGGRFGQNSPVAVSTATAKTGDIDVKIPGLGTVTPLATVTIRAQVSGVMQKIYFTEGQLVKEGDVLALIDPRPYEASLLQAEGNLKRDQALLANARVDLKRYEGLVKEDSIAEQQADTQRALVDQYIGTIESDQGTVKSARVNLSYTRVTAPASGRVGIRQVDQGNYVTAGDTNGIVVLNQLQPITALFTVPEDNVSAISRRVTAGNTLLVEAFDRTNSTKIADGKLSSLDNSIDVTTGTVKLRAEFANTDGALFPNQFVNISLLVDTLKNQVIIPNAAVRRGAPNGVTTTFVYLVNANHTVTVRPVTLGVVDGERVGVTAGLADGDVVVTEGADRLREGATVQLPGAAGPNAAPGAQAVKPEGSRPPASPGDDPSQRRHRPRGQQPPTS